MFQIVVNRLGINLSKYQHASPTTIPVVMENDNGISTIAKNAGTAKCNLSHSILVTGLIMKTPTMTRTGAVVKVENMASVGEKNKKGRNIRPAKTELNPVLAPC